MYVPPPESPRMRRPRRLSSMRRGVVSPQPDESTSSRSSPDQPEWSRDSVSLSSLFQPPSGLKGKLSRRNISKLDVVHGQSSTTASSSAPSPSPVSLGSFYALFPPAQTLQNMLLPSLLNIPLLNWGVGNGSIIGLAVHMAARGASCEGMYGYTELFATLHGTARHALNGHPPMTTVQHAVKEVALNIGAGKEASKSERERLFSCIPKTADVEWIVLAAAVMGFLNTVTHAVVSGLETAHLEDVGNIGEMNWKKRLPPRTKSHGARSNAGQIQADQPQRSLPRAAGSVHTAPTSRRHLLGPFGARSSLDVRYTAGIPGAWPRLGRYLNRRIGHDFPIFRHLHHPRAARALAATLLHSMDGAGCAISVRVKSLVAIMYGSLHGNRRMVSEFKKIARSRGLRAPLFRAVEAFARESDIRTADLHNMRSCLEDAALNHQQQAVLLLAKVCARTQSCPHALRASAKHLATEYRAEVVSWVAVLAVFHRIYSFYLPDAEFRGV